jgi:hypothetical protein
LLANRCVLQQQHVDCKIADALLKRGNKPHADGCNMQPSACAWQGLGTHGPPPAPR